MLLLSSARAAANAANPVEEYHVKAAFVVNFAKFVTWPPGRRPAADAPIVVGVLGDGPFGEALARTVTAARIDGHPVVVRRLERAAEVPQAQVVVINGSARDQVRAVVKAAQESGVLTVGDTDGFARAGVMLNLFLDEQRVRFEANPGAADKAGLRLGAQLLGLARVVREATTP